MGANLLISNQCWMLKALFKLDYHSNNMRTETIEKRYYTFEELNDDQKRQALDKNRYWNVDCGCDWFEYIFEDAKTIAALMGIDITDIFFSGFWSQGNGACFEGDFSFTKGMVRAVKEYAPKDKELQRIAIELSTLHRKAFYGAYGNVRHSGDYYHESFMSIDVDSERGAMDEDEFCEVFADFALWIYKNLQREYEYLQGDEAVSESLIANEVEFEIDEDGNIA